MPHAHEGHDHSHTPTVRDDNQRKVLIAFLITASFMVVEAVGGWLSGSLALLADAGHMLTDAAALVLAYGAFRFGKRAADDKRTFGYMRFEVIAGLINAITLFAIVLWIVIEAINRFRHPGQILAGPMFLVAVVGLLVNLLVFWILTRGDSEHINIKGAVLHVLGDLLGSVAAISAAIVIYFTGWTPIDPILSVFVALLILRSAWSLLRSSLHILLEGAPDHAKPDAIERHLRQTLPELANVRHVHVWSITSGRVLATLHVQAQPDADPRRLVQSVEVELVQRFGIDHATIAIDWPDTIEDACRLGSRADAAHRHHHDADDHEHGDHVHTHVHGEQADPSHCQQGHKH